MTAPPFPIGERWLDRRLDELGVVEGDIAILREWGKASRRRAPVLVAGAGLTAAAIPREGWQRRTTFTNSVPRALLWGQLAAELAGGIDPSDAREQDPLKLAQWYEEKLGRHALLQLVGNAVPGHLLAPGPLHDELAIQEWAAVLTTNYDDLIYAAFDRLGRNVVRVVADQHLAIVPRESDPLEVIHLHGHFDSPESMVITLEDYRKYGQNRPGIIVRAKQLLLQHPVLLVGFSGADPNFDEMSAWVQEIAGTIRPPHVNLIFPKEAEPSSARRGYWKERMAFVACSSEHQLAQVVRVLRCFVDGFGADDVEPDMINRVATAETVSAAVAAILEALDGERGGK